MIIKPSSFFRRPPTVIHPEQIITLNAIRYCVDICEMAFNRLEKNLFEFPQDSISGDYIALIFSDAWTIINNGAIIKKIIQTNFDIDNNNEIFGCLRKLKGLRDTNQHLEERVKQLINYPKLPPLFGLISWYAKVNKDDRKGILSTIYSGTVFRSLNASVENPVGKENEKTVNDIKFNGIERIGRTDEFIECSIYINHIIKDIEYLIENFEQQFQIQFKDIDVSERHVSDLIVQFKIREVEN